MLTKSGSSQALAAVKEHVGTLFAGKLLLDVFAVYGFDAHVIVVEPAGARFGATRAVSRASTRVKLALQAEGQAIRINN